VQLKPQIIHTNQSRILHKTITVDGSLPRRK
jgi:hypothetical protein